MKSTLSGYCCAFISFFLTTQLLGQNNVIENTNVTELQQMAETFELDYHFRKNKAVQAAIQNGWMIRETLDDNTEIELQDLTNNGMPVYYITENLNAAKTISTNNV